AAIERSPPSDADGLRRRAAEQLLRGGHFEEGTAELVLGLKSSGLRLHRTAVGALASLLGQRARLRLRGVAFRSRTESEVHAADLARIDMCWSIAWGLALVDPLRAAPFQVRGLLLSLAAGEPFRLARTLSAEAAF